MKIHEYNEMMAYLTRPAVNRVGFQRGSVALEIGSDTTIGGLTKKERIAQGLEKSRVSTKVDIYTKIVNDHNKAIQEALDAKDASKMPKPFAQTLREKGLKDGTYHALANLKKQIPKALDVSLSRFDLATKVINDYNFELKFMKKEDVLKKANFTPKEIKVLSVKTARMGPGQGARYNPRLPVADKAQDKVRKAFEEFFGQYGNPKYAETAYNDFYNPRELLAKATGLDVGTVSKVNLKSVDPKAYEVYKRLGNADIQKILDTDMVKDFIGSSLGDLKKYVNEDIAKGKKPFQEYQAERTREIIGKELDPKNIKAWINQLKTGAGIHTGHSIRQRLLDPRIAGPQIKKETLKTLYFLDKAINVGGTKYGMSLPTSRHVMAENELLKIHDDRMKLMEQVEGDNFRVIPGKEDEFAKLQAKGTKIAREFSYADELFGVPYGTGAGTQQQVRGTVNFQVFQPDEKGIYKPENTRLVGGDEFKSAAGLSDDPMAREAFADIKKTTANRKRFMDIVWKQLEPRLKDKKDLLRTAEALGCTIEGAAEGGRIGFALGSGGLKNCIKSKFNADPQAVINKVGQEMPKFRSFIKEAFKKAGTPLKWAGNTFNVALGPTGVIGLNYLLGVDPTETSGRIGLEAEAALAPTLVKGATSVTDKIKTPLLRKIAERATLAGMSPAMALRAARIASPIGLLSLAGEGLYHAGKKEMAKREQMSPEELDAYMLEKQSRGWSKMRENQNQGGRVGFGDGTSLPPVYDSRITGSNPTNKELFSQFFINYIMDQNEKGYMSEKDIENLISGKDKKGINSIFLEYKKINPEKLTELSFGVKPFGEEKGIGLKVTKGFNEGGRINFNGGSKPKSPGRRAFLKGITALAALPVVGKFFKIGKVLEAGQYTGPAIDKVKGMPEWFPSLVKKLYNEGEDVTKQMSFKDRQIVKRGELEGGDKVDMYYDLDTGNVNIDVTPKKGGYETTSGAYNKEYSLEYTKGQADEMTKGKKPPDEFGVAEIEGTMDQQAMDVDWQGKITDVDDAMSDLTELEAFAKNKTTTQIHKKKGTKPKDVFPDYDYNPLDDY